LHPAELLAADLGDVHDGAKLLQAPCRVHASLTKAGSLMMVAGEAGIGKTQMLRVRRDGAWARCCDPVGTAGGSVEPRPRAPLLGVPTASSTS
jgi:hypothetical protein